jgi:Magnesium chelatase, subunit ChlI
MLEVNMIRSLAADLSGGRISRTRPFRAPHHSASMAALVGGGTRPRPGEVALAHLGVLFLDELPEFNPQVLDALRQPLENGETVIARANHRIACLARLRHLLGAAKGAKSAIPQPVTQNSNWFANWLLLWPNQGASPGRELSVARGNARNATLSRRPLSY